jgi:hypothetical protein
MMFGQKYKENINMDKMLKQYLDRSKEIIGDRSAGEIAHDNAVVECLNMGLPIEAALTNAGQKHPSEAIQWDFSNINDIAAHYGYLKEHEEIMKKLQKKNRN